MQRLPPKREIPLTELNAKFVGQLRKDSGECLWFDCPVCGPKHTINVGFRNPLDGRPPIGAGTKNEPIWTREGDTLETVSVLPSIVYPCGFHGWVEKGKVVWPDAATTRNGELVLVRFKR